MKAPLDPNEPMFPIRPNEPLCQYYMKHGTCKFAQSCIFNHPPEALQSASSVNAPADAGMPGNGDRTAGDRSSSSNSNSISNIVNKSSDRKLLSSSSASPNLGSANSGGNSSSNNNNSNKPAASYIAVGGGGGGGRGPETSTPVRGRAEPSNLPRHATWGADHGGVQILPQRPGEPNCKYFLHNGRCRYGATCRFHHPIHVVQQQDQNNPNNSVNSNGGHVDTQSNTVNARRQPQQQQQQQHQPVTVRHIPTVSSDSVPKIHYVTSLPANFQQGHFVVSNGSLSFVSLDNNSSPAQVIAIPKASSTNELTNVHQSWHNQQQHNQQHNQQQQQPQTPLGGKSLGLSREVASSTSSTSIASSYDTMGSGNDQYVAYGDSSSSLWTNRRHSNSSTVASATIPGHGTIGPSNSTSNLSAYTADSGGQNRSNHQRTVLIHASSEGAFTTVTPSDHVHFDSSASPPTIARVTGSHIIQPSNASSSTQPSWGRGRRSASFDHSRSRASHQIQKSSSVPEFHGSDNQSPRHRQSRRTNQQQQQQQQQRAQDGNGNDDEGLSRMTSALLTMLDTTAEEIPSEDSCDETLDESEASTPKMRPQYASDRQKHRQMEEQHRPQQQHYMPTQHQPLHETTIYQDSQFQYESGNALEPLGGQFLQQRQQQQPPQKQYYLQNQQHPQEQYLYQDYQQPQPQLQQQPLYHHGQYHSQQSLQSQQQQHQVYHDDQHYSSHQDDIGLPWHSSSGRPRSSSTESPSHVGLYLP